MTTQKIAKREKPEKMVRVRCMQCKKEILLEAQTIAFRKQKYGEAIIAVSLASVVPSPRALRCPHHAPGTTNFLEKAP